MQEVLGEGFEVVGGFDQPLEHRVGVDLEHSGDRPNAQAFRQRTYRPHEPIRRHTLAMKDGAMGVRPENLKLFIDVTFFAFLLMLDQRTLPSSDTPW
jgi:hypothetical protein